MIYTLEARNNITLRVFQDLFKLNNKQCSEVIINEFQELNRKLVAKGIDYSKLKSALIPPHKDKRDIAFIFDSNLIENCWYGYEVFNHLLPALSKDSVNSILCGDIIQKTPSTSFYKNILFDNLVQIHPSTFVCPNQYFVVYINNVTNNQIESLNAVLSSADFYIGYVDMTFNSILKSVLSSTLVHLGIKYKGLFILPHEDDRDDSENVNCPGYSFENYGFSYKSINGMYFNLFLAYKIESEFQDINDVKYSLNAIRSKINRLTRSKIRVSTSKLKYLKKYKIGVLENLGLKDISSCKLQGIIKSHIDRCYVYNLEFLEQYGVSKFNISIELKAIEGDKRKVIVALKTSKKNNKIELVTMY